jgi:uncharacterized protein YegL
VRPDHLGASEYTLVTVILDISRSVLPFAAPLKDCLQKILLACKKSERAENLMVRVVTFNTNLAEVHGFKELHTIDPAAYDDFSPNGMTALYDAAFTGIGATLQYAQQLIDQDFGANGAVYIVTDGDDNASTLPASEVRKVMEQALQGEKIESLIAVLVGIRDPTITGDSWASTISRRLSEFQAEANLTQYVEVGDATPQKLAKLADFVSKSISSQSNALNTGAPSQPISVTF